MEAVRGAGLQRARTRRHASAWPRQYPTVPSRHHTALPRFCAALSRYHTTLARYYTLSHSVVTLLRPGNPRQAD
eukprot:2414-Rhodomonas_salina.2